MHNFMFKVRMHLVPNFNHFYYVIKGLIAGYLIDPASWQPEKHLTAGCNIYLIINAACLNGWPLLVHHVPVSCLRVGCNHLSRNSNIFGSPVGSLCHTPGIVYCTCTSYEYIVRLL